MTDTMTAVTPATDEEIERIRDTHVVGSEVLGWCNECVAEKWPCPPIRAIARIDALKAEKANDHGAMATVLDALGEDGIGLDEDDATADDWLDVVMPAIERLHKQDSDAADIIAERDATIARLREALENAVVLVMFSREGGPFWECQRCGATATSGNRAMFHHAPSCLLARAALENSRE